MNRNFRKFALEKLAAKMGILSKIVEETFNPSKTRPKFKTLGSAGPGTVIMMSENAVKPDGSVDIVINIRGIPGATKSAASLGVNAVVVTAEAGGLGSSKLHKAFGSAAWINHAVSTVLAHLQKQFPDKKIKRGKLVVSGFSGGGGAIASIATQRSGVKGGIDGIIINDGLHSKPGSAGMEAIVEFAREAQKDPTKKFKILHTAIVPWSPKLGRYTSTTESANYILDRLGLERQMETESTEFGFKPTSHARSGGVEIVAMHDMPGRSLEESKKQHVDALKKGHPWLFRDILS
jgi:hypothetical protein